MARYRVGSVIFLEDGGAVIEFTRERDNHEHVSVAQQVTISGEAPEFADLLDELRLLSERTLSKVDSWLATPPWEARPGEVDDEVEVSRWDNPLERDLTQAAGDPS